MSKLAIGIGNPAGKLDSPGAGAGWRSPPCEPAAVGASSGRGPPTGPSAVRDPVAARAGGASAGLAGVPVPFPGGRAGATGVFATAARSETERAPFDTAASTGRLTVRVTVRVTVRAAGVDAGLTAFFDPAFAGARADFVAAGFARPRATRAFAAPPLAAPGLATRRLRPPAFRTFRATLRARFACFFAADMPVPQGTGSPANLSNCEVLPAPFPHRALNAWRPRPTIGSR